MIEIKHDMLKDLNFYGIYGFLQSASNHRDYCNQDEGCEIFKQIQAAIKEQRKGLSVKANALVSLDKSKMLDWLSDMMARGMIICPTT